MILNLDMDRAGAALEEWGAAEICAWVERHFGPSAIATVSLQDPVLAHLVTLHAPSAPLVFIDTGYHFSPTWRYKELLETRLRREIKVVSGSAPLDHQWKSDPDGCCHRRKVVPLQEALTDAAAWISGVRRSDHESRRHTPVAVYDERSSVAKINPLATWNDDATQQYITHHGLPTHPLNNLGYTSIGCWPCTTPVAIGEDARAGRWRDTAKVECGLHHPHEVSEYS